MKKDSFQVIVLAFIVMLPLLFATVMTFDNLQNPFDLTEISSEEEKRGEKESEEKEEVDGPEIFFLNENTTNTDIGHNGLSYFTICKHFPFVAPEVELEPPESAIFEV